MKKTALIRKIAEKSEQIIEPKDYFNGIKAETIIPDIDNIILLYRWPGRPIDPGAKELFHQRYVLTLNLQTDGIAYVNERMINFKQGSALLIFPFQLHNYIVDMKTFRWLVITFEANGVIPSGLMNKNITMSAECCETANMLLDTFFNTNNETMLSKSKLKKYLELLILELLECSSNIADEEKTDQGKTAGTIEKINGYIHKHLSDPDLSLDRLAITHGISKGYLCGLFKTVTGHGPGEYIRSARINRAIKMLHSRNYLISEIAENCGFTSPAIFSRSFHREVGMSPRQYINTSLTTKKSKR